MSTTYLSIHDLLRVTYTYEAQAVEAESQARKRTDSLVSVCLTPEACSHYSDSDPSPNARFAALETDFTSTYARK